MPSVGIRASIAVLGKLRLFVVLGWSANPSFGGMVIGMGSMLRDFWLLEFRHHGIISIYI
jgi:hypothetical protein